MLKLSVNMGNAIVLAGENDIEFEALLGNLGDDILNGVAAAVPNNIIPNGNPVFNAPVINVPVANAPVVNVLGNVVGNNPPIANAPVVDNNPEYRRIAIINGIWRIDSCVVRRGEVLYMCQFHGHSLEQGRYVSANYLRGRESLIATYWNDRILREDRELEFGRQAVMLSDNAGAVLRD